MGTGSNDVLVASVCVLGVGLGWHVTGEEFLPGYPSRGGWEGRSASVCICACMCVYELSPVVVCGPMSIVLFFSFLKIQLEGHLLPSTLAESVAPSLLPECSYLDESIYATCGDAGLHAPLPLQVLVLGDPSAEMLSPGSWLS